MASCRSIGVPTTIWPRGCSISTVLPLRWGWLRFVFCEKRHFTGQMAISFRNLAGRMPHRAGRIRRRAGRMPDCAGRISHRAGRKFPSGRPDVASGRSDGALRRSDPVSGQSDAMSGRSVAALRRRDCAFGSRETRDAPRDGAPDARGAMNDQPGGTTFIGADVNKVRRRRQAEFWDGFRS